MKSEFVQPRFVGQRFNESTLPVDIAGDLAAYEKLVKEVAKRLYLKDHPERERVPRGFASDFQLHIERVDGGSAKPLLSIVAAGILAMDAGTANYLNTARDLVTSCIQSADGNIPAEFPKDLLVYFNKIGGSLRQDEQVEFNTDGETAVLTPERCKRLVLAASNVYEREVEIAGTIQEANWAKRTFQLRLMNGTLLTVPMLESFGSVVGGFGGNPRHAIIVSGVGVLDANDRIKSVQTVSSLEVQFNYELAERFTKLGLLEDGWLDGLGVAPNSSGFDSFAGWMVNRFPRAVPFPAIVPTPEGGLLLEWSALGDPSLDVDLGGMTADFHSFRLLDGADTEKTFPLHSEKDWKELFAFLELNIEQDSDE